MSASDPKRTLFRSRAVAVKLEKALRRSRRFGPQAFKIGVGLPVFDELVKVGPVDDAKKGVPALFGQKGNPPDRRIEIASVMAVERMGPVPADAVRSVFGKLARLLNNAS